LVFFLPSVVKFEHHHEHKFYKTVYENQFSVLHERCAICDFEFSVYLTTSKKVELLKNNPLDNYINNYQSVYHSNFSYSSFSLRAPPLNIHS